MKNLSNVELALIKKHIKPDKFLSQYIGRTISSIRSARYRIGGGCYSEIPELRLDDNKIKSTLYTVLVQGKKREIPTNSVTSEMSETAKIRTLFQFVRKSKPLYESVSSDEFMVLKLSQPSEKVSLPNNKKVKICRDSVLRTFILFRNRHPLLFGEIMEEIVCGNFEIPNDYSARVGTIRLTEYALCGHWDTFPLGFAATIMTSGPNDTLVPATVSYRKDDGTIGQRVAITNTGNHFVLEENIHNIESLRSEIRQSMGRWRVE